ncbi:MAG: hypothetical protein GY832_42280 [Chloroflexi bacterium]|nr:hypothetical protein [Chloroflexota bacterium]
MLALEAQIPHRQNNAAVQVGTLFLQDGTPIAYQLLSDNPQASLSPTIASDEAGQLYLTWIEYKQASSYNIYFASTIPDIRQALSSLTGGDIVRIVSNTLFGLLRGAVFFPFAALIWLAAPTMLLALAWWFRRDRNNLTNRPALVSIALALCAYWVGKLTTFASARTYVPFSAWIPIIPPWLEFPLQLGVPIITTIIALGAAWHYTNRSTTELAALFVMIYAGVDSLFTMAVYGGLLYNAF